MTSLKRFSTEELRSEIARRSKPNSKELLSGLKAELSEYKLLYSQACFVLDISKENLPKSLNLKNARKVLTKYKDTLSKLQDQLSKLNTVTANRLVKSISDASDGSYSYLEEIK